MTVKIMPNPHDDSENFIAIPDYKYNQLIKCCEYVRMAWDIYLDDNSASCEATHNDAVYRLANNAMFLLGYSFNDDNHWIGDGRVDRLD